ncbi:MAG: hypothetical protein FD137_1761 [Spirochaetes bacterium]|nr:MAG: hypothetical protein FD137_1761 [Spirochaetota bacterium]
MANASKDATMRKRLAIPESRLDAVNATLLDPDSPIMKDFMAVVAKYGSPEPGPSMPWRGRWRGRTRIT